MLTKSISVISEQKIPSVTSTAVMCSSVKLFVAWVTVFKADLIVPLFLLACCGYLAADLPA